MSETNSEQNKTLNPSVGCRCSATASPTDFWSAAGSPQAFAEAIVNVAES